MAIPRKNECLLGCGATFAPNKDDETGKALIRRYFPNITFMPDSIPTEEEHHMTTHGFMRCLRDNSSKTADSWICVASSEDGYNYGDYAERGRTPILVPASIYGQEGPKGPIALTSRIRGHIEATTETPPIHTGPEHAKLPNLLVTVHPNEDSTSWQWSVQAADWNAPPGEELQGELCKGHSPTKDQAKAKATEVAQSIQEKRQGFG